MTRDRPRTNKTNVVRGAVSSLSWTAVVRSCAQGVPGLWGTINRRGLFILWGGTDGAVDTVRTHTGREAYAPGWLHQQWWMGEKKRARITQRLGPAASAVVRELGVRCFHRFPLRSEVVWSGEARAPARDDMTEICRQQAETDVRGVLGQIGKFVRAAVVPWDATCPTCKP